MEIQIRLSNSRNHILFISSMPNALGYNDDVMVVREITAGQNPDVVLANCTAAKPAMTIVTNQRGYAELKINPAILQQLQQGQMQQPQQPMQGYAPQPQQPQYQQPVPQFAPQQPQAPQYTTTPF